MSTYQRVLLAVLVIVTCLSWIKPLYPKEMYLQHLPTALLVIVLLATARRFPLSDVAFTCIICFMALHVLGARYIYSYVPYDRWLQALIGVNLTEMFGFQRNHYDRLVHFFFGVLWVRPVWEICTRHFGVPRRFAYYTAFEFVLAFSMLYELLEWCLAIVLSPEGAAAYNGQQGDIWDAQKDMSFALLGALLAVAVLVAIDARMHVKQIAGS